MDERNQPGEVFYAAAKFKGWRRACEIIQKIAGYPVAIVDADRELTLEAARLKAKYTIAYANCFPLALAKLKNASLLTGDPEFKKTEEEVEFIWLGDTGG